MYESVVFTLHVRLVFLYLVILSVSYCNHVEVYKICELLSIYEYVFVCSRFVITRLVLFSLCDNTSPDLVLGCSRCAVARHCVCISCFRGFRSFYVLQDLDEVKYFNPSVRWFATKFGF